jgi:hypothetical protein
VSRSGSFSRPPLWLRWVLSVLVAVVVLILVVRFVDTHNSDATASQSPAAEAQANREGEIVVAQDQAPHVAALKAGVVPAAGIAHAVRADINHQINQGILNGPLQRTRCSALRPRAGALPFSCTVVAANVNYPFLGVVDVRARRITYCKRDPPPVPTENIPVSRRCQV